MSTTPVVKVTTTKVEDGKFTFNISITVDVSSTASQSTEPEPQSVHVQLQELDGVTQRTVIASAGGDGARGHNTAVEQAAVEEDDDDTVSSHDDEGDTKRLLEDLKYWDVKAFYGERLLVWPTDIRSVYRGRHKESDPVIHTGTLYDKPIYLDKTVHGDGYWVKKHSRLGQLFLQNHRFKEECANRSQLEADMKKHWFVKSINADGDPDRNALIGVTEKSAYKWWHQLDTHGLYHRHILDTKLDTHGLYHRHIYYISDDDGYWVNKDSDLVKMIRESGNAGREDPIAKAEEAAEEESEKAKRLDAETKALRADLRYWEIIKDTDKTDSGCFRYERSLLIDPRDTRSRFWDPKFMMPINKVPTGRLYHDPTIVRHGLDRGFWIKRDSILGRLMLEKNCTRKLKVVVPDEDKPIENVPSIQDDWKNWEIVRWEDKENAVILPTEKSVFSHCPAEFNGKMGVPVVWARTGPSPDQKSMLKYDRDREGYCIHFSSVLMVYLPRYTYDEYYYSQYGRWPTDSIPLLADDQKHWEFVAWKNCNRIIVRPGSKSKYHNCPAIVSLARHKSIGGSVGYVLRYDTTYKGYCVDADDENFASIPRPTYEEYLADREAIKQQDDFAQDILNHWQIVKLSKKDTALVRPKGGSSYEHCPAVIHTHNLYHRPLYYSKRWKGYWINAQSDLFTSING